MAARELGRAGKKVIVLEARDRIGGRIFPLPEREFGYPAQGGAEFVHGPAKVTRALMDEAGLTYVASKGERWTVRDGKIIKNEDFSPKEPDAFQEKLRALMEDVPISDFLEKYFGEEKYEAFRKSIVRMVQGYDAADPRRASTFSLRDEWLSGDKEWQQGRIKEGYTALLGFLLDECKALGVEMRLAREAESIVVSQEGQGATIRCTNAEKYHAQKVIITLPLPVISSLHFESTLSEKIEAASKIGFGGVIKLLLRFNLKWWTDITGSDFSKMSFLFGDEIFPTWWAQYPESSVVLTGWLAGPPSEKLKDNSSEEILQMGLTSLAHTFKMNVRDFKKELIAWQAVNWFADPFARGAYSYVTVDSYKAREELMKPVADTIFFAGEALYSEEEETATVEGALGSGKEVAEKILRGA
jgi:monoamine oxidase